MRTILVVAVFTGVVSVAGAAFAQSNDGSGIPVAEEEVQGYPQALVDRPILLPHGAEGTVAFYTSKNDVTDLFDIINMQALGRFGTGKLELFGAFELRAKQPDGSDADALSAIQGGAAFELGPDQVLRGTFTLLEPTNDVIKFIDATGDFEIKRKLAPKVALIATGGVDFFNALPDEPFPEALWVLSAFARGEGQVQLTPTLAASGVVTAIIPVAHNPDGLETENVFNIGAQGTMVLAPNLDAIGGFSVNDAFDDAQRNTWFFVGGALRL